MTEKERSVATPEPGKLKVTYVRSVIGQKPDAKRTVAALGLKRLHQTVEHQDSAQVRGMIHKVRHLVRVEEAR